MKKMLAVLLAVSIVLTLGVTAFAAFDDTSVAEPSKINPTDGKYSADTEFSLKIDKDTTNPELNSQINVSIPLTVAMYGYGADGSAAEPTTYRIVNNGEIDIKVASIETKTAQGWTMDAGSSIAGLTLGGDGKMSAYNPANNNLTEKHLVLYVNGVDVKDGVAAPVASNWTVDKKDGTATEKVLPLECFVAKGTETASVPVVTLTYTIAAA